MHNIKLLHNHTVIIDTREQAPLDFTSLGIMTTCRGLQTGDYSLVGYENRVGFERKSLNDLVACLTTERGRFELELIRAKKFEMFAVVVEASFSDVEKGLYRSLMTPQAAIWSIFSFTIKYRPFIWAKTPENAAFMVAKGFEVFLRDEAKKTRKRAV